MRRWDLAAVAAAALALRLAAFTGSAFFLHFDAPTQDVAAMEWVAGCWGYSTSKVLPFVLLGPLYRLFGVAPAWETLLLGLGWVVSVAAVYELARLFTGRRLAGLLAALMLLALPAFHYFGQTHLAYPMPFLLLGWLAVSYRRWGWAGLSFGLAITAHYNSWVPVGLTLAALAVTYWRTLLWRPGLRLVAGIAAPLLATDALFFMYSGQWFEWDRGVFHEVFKLSQSQAAAPQPDWAWLGHTVAGSNGLALSLALAVGVLAPLALRRSRVGLACALAFVGLAALYTVEGGLGRAFLPSRVLASSYPFWAVCAGSVAGLALGRLASVPLRQGLALVVAAALAWAALGSALFMREFGQTPYPQIETWMEAAGQAGQPIRYTGNMWVGLFYARRSGMEILANDPTWIEANAPGQAVLIFEGAAPVGLSADGYRVETTDISDTADGRFPVLSGEASLPRHAEVWWPQGQATSIQPESKLPAYAQYYSGTGCLTPPAYGNHTLHFYQLVWRRLTGGKSS